MSIRKLFGSPEDMSNAARQLSYGVLINTLDIDMSAVEPTPAPIVPMIRSGRPNRPTVPISNRGGACFRTGGYND